MNPDPSPEARFASQKAQILKALQRGASLTSLDILREFNCFSAAQRIQELRQNHLIKTEMIRLANGKRVAQYSLIKQENND